MAKEWWETYAPADESKDEWWSSYAVESEAAKPQGRRDVTPFKVDIQQPRAAPVRQAAAAPEVSTEYSPSGDDFGSAIMAAAAPAAPVRSKSVLDNLPPVDRTKEPGFMLRPEFVDQVRNSFASIPPEKRRQALIDAAAGTDATAQAAQRILFDVQKEDKFLQAEEGSRQGMIDIVRKAPRVKPELKLGNQPKPPVVFPDVTPTVLERADAYKTSESERIANRLRQDEATRTVVGAETSLEALADRADRESRDFSAEAFAKENPYRAALESGGRQIISGLANSIPTIVDFAARVIDATKTGVDTTGNLTMSFDTDTFNNQNVRAPTYQWADRMAITARSLMPEAGRQNMASAFSKGEFGSWLGLNLTAQAPQMATSFVAAILPAARPFLLPAMGAQSAGQSFGEGDSSLGALIKGGAEIVGERITLGVFDRTMSSLSKLPLSLQAPTIQSVGRALAATGKVVTAQGVVGALEETTTKILQNGVDRYLEDKDVGLLDQTADAAVLGAFMEGPLALVQGRAAFKGGASSFADALAGDVAGAQFDPAAFDAYARRALDVQSYDAALIRPYQAARVQEDQTALQTSTTATDAATAADNLSGSLNELLVPSTAITPLPLDPTLDMGQMAPSVGRAEPILDLGIPAPVSRTIEPALDLNAPAAEVPGINQTTEQQFGLDKLRINAPRPQSIQGTPVADLTDDQLQVITGDETVAPISRRSAAIELTARQGEQAPAPTPVAETRVMTPEELGAMPIRDRRALASQFDQTENEDGTITFTAKPGAAPSTQIVPTPGTEQTLGTAPVRDVGNQPVLDNETVRADAQRSLDRWAVDNGQAIPAKLNPAPDAETRAVGTIANLLGSQFGTRVIAFHDTSPGSVQGVAVGGTAFVNTANVVTNVGRVSLHELKHTIEQIAFTEKQAGLTDTSAQKFTAQIDSIFDDMTEEGKRAYVTNFLHAAELAALDSTPDIKESRIQELLQSPVLRSEMTADFMGNRATDKAFWADVAKADPGGFKGFVQKWVSVIDNLMSTLRGQPKLKTESAKVDQYVHDLGKAKMVAREALIAYRQGTLQQFESAPAASLRQGEINAPTIGTRGSENLPGPTAQDRPGFSEDGGGPTPTYGTARAGAISVVGRHYSTTPRQTLSGAYYGQGLKGAERTRLDSSTDPRLKNRVYFYVDQGAGIRPESGVGGYAHEAKLDNIYDPQTRLIKPQADANAFESAVINAGFDGYVAPFGNGQSAVVLLGQKHKAVPVRQIGQPRAAALSAEAAPTTLKKGLLTREASQVDTGNIPGSRMRMGTLEIPAGQVEAANTEMGRIGSEIRFAKRQAAPARVMFEVAPDPNNLDLKTRWDAVPFERKIEISQRVAAKIMPQVFRLAGVRAKMTTQLGGYLEDTSPSFAAIVPSSASAQQLMDVARVGGFGLAQDSMMVLDSKPFEGSSPTGLITITLPENMQGQEDVHSVYRAVRKVSPENISGHTTVGQEMVLAVPSDRMADLTSKIAGVLNARPENFSIGFAEGHMAFPTKEEYDYGSETGAVSAELFAKRTEASRIRQEASAAIEAELATDESAGGRKIDTGRYRSVADALSLSQAEYDATALPLMLGGTKGKTFRAPNVGGIPEIVQWLDQRRADSGLPKLDLNKPEDRTTLAKLLASEAVAAIRSAGNAVEWYDETVAKTLQIMAVKYPELDTDPNARNAFLLAVAISSQTMDVEANLKYASQQYEQFRNTGQFPETGTGKSAPAMAKNFALANDVLADMGPGLLRRFLQTEFTKRELETIGFPIGGESMDEKMLGSAIFGPKIGFGFYSNLSGNFEPITMDMWFMRTVGRLAGTLPAFDPVLFPKQVAKLRAALAETGPAERGVYAAQFDPAAVQAAMETDEGAVALARQVSSLHNRQFIKERAAFDSGTRIKTPLVGAAGAILKSADKPTDAPSSGGERQRLRDVTRQMVAMVEQQTGKRVPPAALQALIWYPEQELYKKLGAGLYVTSQDYAGAAKSLLTKEGFDGKRIDTAAKPGPRPARQVAGKPVAGTNKQAGQPGGPTGPIQGAERETFIQSQTPLEDIFAGLEKRGLAKTRAEAAFTARPDGAQIKYVQENFNDILIQLEDADKVKINCK